LTAFDRAADGTLTNRRVWAALEGIAPDGICLCADGTVWVANAGGAECVRIAEGGSVHERVTTSRNCYACMLGDDDRRTLYLVTALDSNASVARASRDGALEKVRTTVPGAGLP
jgi:sugar lactone lactonase YvrE